MVIFFRTGILSVWDVTPENSGCVATLQTHMDNYTHTCEVLQEEQATLIGLATGAHDTYVITLPTRVHWLSKSVVIMEMLAGFPCS
jgi:hypothetical protein